MPRFDTALLGQAQTAISIVGAGERAHLSSDSVIRREWRIDRLEALYELAYLRIFAAWETYLEAIFYRSLCGYASVAGQEVLLRGSHYRTVANAEAAILGTRRSYILWHNPQQVIDRCRGNIKSTAAGGGPCVQESVITANFTRLGYFAATRHRIVHNQYDAKLKFDAATQYFAGRTYQASRPGKFLRDYDSTKTPPTRWLEGIVTELGALLRQMV